MNGRNLIENHIETKIRRSVDALERQVRRPIPTSLERLHEVVFVLAVGAAILGGVAGYSWGMHTRQDVVFEAGYQACRAEQVVGGLTR